MNLRLRLALVYGLMATLALTLALVAGYGFYERAAFRNLDGVVRLFGLLARPEAERPGASGPLELPQTGAPLALRVLDPEGRVLRSGGAAGAPEVGLGATARLADEGIPAHAAWIELLPKVAPAPQSYRGYGLAATGQTRWRLYATRLADGRYLQVFVPLEATDRALALVRRNFAAVGGFGALLVMLAGFALSAPSLRPLNRLAASAQGIVREHADDPAAPAPGDDLRRLDEAIRLTVARLRDERERLSIALAGAEMGWWEWDPTADRHRWSPEFERLLGLGPGEFKGGPEAFLAQVHPDDRERVAGLIRAEPGRDRPQAFEYRVALPGGRVRWLESRAHVYREAGGRVVRVLGIDTDVTERKRAEEALRESERRYRELSEAQKRFVADAAHELRAPLTAILGNLEIVTRYRHMDPQDRDEALEEAAREARRLGRLVADMLALARGDAGVAVRREPVRLDRVLSEAFATASALTQSHRMVLEPLPEVELWGDPDRLKQLALQLLENAVKYTPEGGEVRLGLAVRDGHAEFRVADTGVGIAPEDLPRVFERFYRADKARSRQAEGTGLGLSIARWITEAHGGRIRLESEPGQGTRALVRLPLAVPALTTQG